MSRSFKVQQDESGTPFFQPHSSSPYVVGTDKDGAPVVPSLARKETENSARVDEYKKAKAEAELEGNPEPEGYSAAEGQPDLAATLVQDRTGDWNIEDFLVGGLVPGADTDAVKLALRRHVALAVDDGVGPDEVDEFGNKLDQVEGDELSELPGMSGAKLRAALALKGVEYAGDDVQVMKEKLTSAILMDVGTTSGKYVSNQYAESSEGDGDAADFEALQDMMSGTAAIGIRTNGDEDWDADGAKDGAQTQIGGQLLGTSGDPLLLGESDSAELLLAASDGAFADVNGKEQLLEVYYDEAFEAASKGDPSTAPYGPVAPDLVGRPLYPQTETTTP